MGSPADRHVLPEVEGPFEKMRVNVEFATQLTQFALQTLVGFHVRFSQIEYYALTIVEDSISGATANPLRSTRSCPALTAA